MNPYFCKHVTSLNPFDRARRHVLPQRTLPVCCGPRTPTSPSRVQARSPSEARSISTLLAGSLLPTRSHVPIEVVATLTHRGRALFNKGLLITDARSVCWPQIIMCSLDLAATTPPTPSLSHADGPPAHSARPFLDTRSWCSSMSQ